ncbi:putative membrane protein [Acinetobacter baumannii 916567]|nr:putative membrane protein [Acinetobacter baumannii 916567]
MCDSFEKIISLLANIATILGAILAFVVWSTVSIRLTQPYQAVL